MSGLIININRKNKVSFPTSYKSYRNWEHPQPYSMFKFSMFRFLLKVCKEVMLQKSEKETSWTNIL